MVEEGAPDSFEVDFDEDTTVDFLFVNLAVTLLFATMEALAELQVFNVIFNSFALY